MDAMMDYINECLRCEGLSYVVEENKFEGHTYKLYECEKCGFKWEIIEVGNGTKSV